MASKREGAAVVDVAGAAQNPACRRGMCRVATTGSRHWASLAGDADAHGIVDFAVAVCGAETEI